MVPGETALLCRHVRPINMEGMDVRDGRWEKVSQLLLMRSIRSFTSWMTFQIGTRKNIQHALARKMPPISTAPSYLRSHLH
jgi:hypothetical protein